MLCHVVLYPQTVRINPSSLKLLLIKYLVTTLWCRWEPVEPLRVTLWKKLGLLSGVGREVGGWG